MVTHTIFLLSINCKKKKCSIFKTTKAEKSSNSFRCALSLRVLKIEHFFFLQLIDNKKITGGYHIPMINLGKCKEVTAVLKL